MLRLAGTAPVSTRGKASTTAAVPAPELAVRQPSPSSSTQSLSSSAESSPVSTLSTKEQRHQQLQALRRQQREHFKKQLQRQSKQVQQQYMDGYGHDDQDDAVLDIKKHGPMWTSQETWIDVENGTSANDNERSIHWDRRHSHLSDKHMNIGAMKLLSDETPPDDMDGSWGLDDLDDDHRNMHDTQGMHFRAITPTPTSTLRRNEQNDSNITKKNNDKLPTLTITKSNDQRTSKSTSAHGYDHLGGSTTISSRTLAKPQKIVPESESGINDTHGDAVDQQNNGSSSSSSSSFLSTHVRKSPPSSRKDINDSKPWRDSKHETIFTDLMNEQALMDQLRDQQDINPVETSKLQRTAQECGRSHPVEVHANEGDTASSVSLDDIIDAVNKGDDSIDPARSSKRQQAKQRLAELSRQDNNIEDPLVGRSPTADLSSSRVFHSNQDAFNQQRLRVIQAAMKIDPNDDRSLAPQGDKTKLTTPTSSGNGNLQIRPNGASRRQSNIPMSTRTSRISYGSRHRSQGSRDTEIGDRGSTTSRDSVYRDSLSGSTLGSAGFHAQLDGMNKHELNNVLVALKSAAVAQLFHDEARNSTAPTTVDSTAAAVTTSARILPRNVNSRSVAPTSSQPPQIESVNNLPAISVEAAVASNEIRGTPHSQDRPLGSAEQRRRPTKEQDPLRARQYAALSNRTPSKQINTFVEELANGTAMKSTSSSPDSRATADQGHGKTQTSHLREFIDLNDDDIMHRNARSDRQRREVTFKSTSSLQDMDAESDTELIGHGADDVDIGFLAGSRGVENAFSSLAALDLSIDVMSTTRGFDTASARDLNLDRHARTDDERDDYLSAVSLPSKPKRRGEFSLKWENQIDAASNADTSRLGFNTSIISHEYSTKSANDGSGMAAEQSSFSQAEGHLIRSITSLHPWKEWDQVKTLDLSKREVESTIKLNHLVPNLGVLILNDNRVQHLTGIPKSTTTLQVRSNLLDDLTNFSHLSNLQYLDISNNSIENLTGISSLVHLRELMAEGNRIRSVSAFQQMDGLIRLDVSKNCLTSLDFRWSKLQRLEYLNASHNKIEQLENLETLTGLIHANLAHNCIEDVSLLQPLRRLRILRLSENKLLTFDATPFPGLRTLYLDDNRLQNLENCQKLTRLENFSARDQEGEGIAIDMTEFVNSRKLYLSGNPVHALDFEVGFYRLEYLEICAGCLSELPMNFASLFPNLRGLNLSYNSLDSIMALDGLHRLRRLIFVGNNLKSFSDILSLVKRMRSLTTLDFRHNPLTSNMYAAMSLRQGSKYQDTYRTNQNSETELDWRRRDVGFRRALPDTVYVKRSVYRSAIIKSCKRLEWFDGGAIQNKERERVPVVLGDMLDSYGRNYMTSNRREDEEEYEIEGGYEDDGYFQNDYQDIQQQEADWLQYQGQFEQLNQDDDAGLGVEDDYDLDDRDPEDITDQSKRASSSVDSGSLSGQLQQRSRSHRQQPMYDPKSPSSRPTSFSQQQQPQVLHSSQNRYQAVSPSPKGPKITPGVSSMTLRMGSNRMNSSSTLSQNPVDANTRKRLSKRSTSTGNSLGQRDQGEPREHEYEVDDGAGNPHDEYFDGATDYKRSAVRNWRDEVYEVSQRKAPLPKSPAGISSTVTQQQRSQVRRRGDDNKSVVSGTGSRSSGSSDGAMQRRQEISTTAVANNSSENRLSADRRSGSRKISIPAPQPQTPQQQPMQARPMRPRRRSDGAATLMARPGSSAVNRRHSRPISQQHGMMAGHLSVEASPGNHQQLPSMSPMGGPSGMTFSGTVLRPSYHHRRRSFTAYPQGSTANVRSPGMAMTMSASAHQIQAAQSSPLVSPGYLTTSYPGLQSPFGLGKSAINAAATPGPSSGRRSVPNTPSRGTLGPNGRAASRVSLGPHHFPQTLARDMERSEMAD